MADSAGPELHGLTPEALAAALQALYRQTDESLRQRFARSLPFQDGLLDRWERARRLGFAEGASIYNSAAVFGQVSVGRQTWVGPNVILDGSAAPLSVGAFCSIAAGVHVYTHDTVLWSLSGGVSERRAGAVSIGDRVYLGAQSVVALGTRIGSQVVVAANSFVNRDVEERTVVGGVPARPIGRVVGEGADVSLCFEERK